MLGVEDVPPWTRPPAGHPGPRHLALSLNFADCLLVRNLYQEKPALPFTPGGEFCGPCSSSGPSSRRAGRSGSGRWSPGRSSGAAPWRRSWSCPTRARPRVRRPRGDLPSRRVVPHRVRHGVHGAGAARARRAGDACAGARRGRRRRPRRRADRRRSAPSWSPSLAARRKSRRAAPPAPTRAWTATRCTRRQTRSTRMYTKKKKGDVRVAPVGDARRVRRGNLADVLFDPVGGDAFHRGLSSIRWGGQALVIGFASGSIPALPLNVALVKNITVHGVYWGAHAAKDPGAKMRDMRAAKWGGYWRADRSFRRLTSPRPRRSSARAPRVRGARTKTCRRESRGGGLRGGRGDAGDAGRAFREQVVTIE